MQVLGWVPITSMTVMPERAVLSDVPAWQILGSLFLLVVSIVFVRRWAARIYEAGMLMYGKEPSLAEMLRWTRAARG
jgi:ABC-2 type transport system permease protein